ncbi:carboxypeptidase-like regulatory domain-containing protein [Hymenobacter sediminicola]|uniref:Carboxypeptidase regulatory-like domain-containing protein n=1 Tax=Hymenobacter sediminicola TaxID=2761579 RepID=A0A7G7W3W3_9BACT|nr:carboxypeptidase-like regulatory domain-containing protein [Hymenobacter sediminicola]QNH61056.1 carboxypeptidase regulatory-like domain-containing protein [Hymenobacter sediminicola]
MRLLQTALLIFFIGLLSGCEFRRESIRDVAVEIRVVDAATGKPIQGAEVLIVGIYDGPHRGTADGDSLIQAVTPATGLVKASLLQARVVGVAAQAPGYLPARQKVEVNQPVLAVTIPLRRAKPNTTLSKHLYYHLGLINDEELGHIYVDDSLRADIGSPVEIVMDYRYQERDVKIPDSYGINLSTARTSRDTTVCDVWLEPGPNNSQPTVFIAGGKGGIIPIINLHYSPSVVFDFDEAPATGYQKRYVLTGKENGFFIKTRDGNHYGKFFLSGTWSNFQAGAYEKDEPYNVYRWQGSCLFQSDGSRNLRVEPMRVNLLYFLRKDIP